MAESTTGSEVALKQRGVPCAKGVLLWGGTALESRALLATVT